MKIWLTILVFSGLITSCGSLQKINKAPSNNLSAKKLSSNSSNPANPRFINGIETKEDKQLAKQQTVNYTPGKNQNGSITNAGSMDIEKASALQFIYAAKLGTEVEAITNYKLFQLIDDWWGTHYRMGGTTKDGIDCSAFACTLMSAVFAVNLPRTSKDQYAAASKIDNAELSEGDLVFFNTKGGISHVGIYLTNNKFVHASTSGGVMISDLNEPYWKARYKGAGRMK
jgi:cell wall-associated NlpC family hydrolase